MTLTEMILIAAVILLSVYDWCIYLVKGIESTISATIWEQSKKYPLIPFLIGGVCGHLLWHF